MDFSATYLSSPRKITYHFKCKAIKKTVLSSQATKNKGVHRLYLRYANQDDDACSYSGTAVCASGTF